MTYLNLNDLNALLPEGWHKDKDPNRALLIANVWLGKQGLPDFEEVPDAIKQAGAEIALAFVDDAIYQGRSEGVVVSKSVKAGDVSTSKNYADGADGQAISAHEMLALDLIKPYISSKGIGGFVPLGRF